MPTRASCRAFAHQASGRPGGRDGITATMTPADIILIQAAAEGAGYKCARLGPLGLSASPAQGAIANALIANQRIDARRDGEHYHNWNPLHEPEHAARLVYHLGIETRSHDGAVWAVLLDPGAHMPYLHFVEPIAGDYSSAERRAITRAAAHRVQPDPKVRASQASIMDRSIRRH